MKIFRGPSSKSYYDDSHEFVSRITPDQLEEGIRSSALIRFNISKNAVERQAVCTAQFEGDDIIPVINGLLARLTVNQDCLAKINGIVSDKSLSATEKLVLIQAALSHAR